MTKAYTVDITWDGMWWMVTVPELDALTQARRMEDVATAAAELIALETGVAIADVEIEQHILSPGEGTAPRAGLDQSVLIPPRSIWWWFRRGRVACLPVRRRLSTGGRRSSVGGDDLARARGDYRVATASWQCEAAF
jgi:hypothetical protein